MRNPRNGQFTTPEKEKQRIQEERIARCTGALFNAVQHLCSCVPSNLDSHNDLVKAAYQLGRVEVLLTELEQGEKHG